MISIICVNWNSYDFLQVMMESLNWFSQFPHELIVIDNSIEKKIVKGAKWFPQKSNIGHGAGLNEGVKQSNPQFPYVMFLDVDVHFLKHGWENDFLTNLSKNDVVGAQGVPEKPIRPACMFMKRGIATKYDWKPTPGYKGHRVTPKGFDVAIEAYHQMTNDGVQIKFMESYPNRYGTLTGEEWGLGCPLVYHHWHGSHTKERQVDFENDLEKEKQKLLSSVSWRLL